MGGSVIKVLWIAKDTSTYLDRNYFYLEQELARKVDLVTWRQSGHIRQILKSLAWKPDFILIVQDIGPRFEPIIHGLHEVDISSAVFINDVHRFTEERRSFLKKHRHTFLFSVTRDACMKTYPEYANRIQWFPHFVEPSVFYDRQFKKEIGILLLGQISDVYPFRQHVENVFHAHPEFVTSPHPGYKHFSRASSALVGHFYAQQLNQSKIFLTCPSIYAYPVKKYFEALACNTLLVAPAFTELEDLGFIPGFHFAEASEDTVQSVVEYYLTHEKERQTIAKNGHDFIRHTHTTSIRANQLIQKMKEIQAHIP
ncbi:glycosyltransferase [Alkalihalobacillus sp. NPDC078783]